MSVSTDPPGSRPGVWREGCGAVGAARVFRASLRWATEVARRLARARSGHDSTAPRPRAVSRGTIVLRRPARDNGGPRLTTFSPVSPDALRSPVCGSEAVALRNGGDARFGHGEATSPVLVRVHADRRPVRDPHVLVQDGVSDHAVAAHHD